MYSSRGVPEGKGPEGPRERRKTERHFCCGDAGNAGNGSPQTFLDVRVTDTLATSSVYSNSGGWHLRESWTQPVPEPATLALLAAGGLLALLRRRLR